MRMTLRFQKIFRRLAIFRQVQDATHSPVFQFMKFATCALMLVALPTTKNAFAATVTATSCSAADVQTALNKAAAGDTVAIPAGTCTWTTTVNWNAPANVTLQGAGVPATVGNNDATMIIDSIGRSGYDSPLLNIVTNATGTFRMTGISLRNSGDPSTRSYNGSVRIYGNTKKLRIDHNHFDHVSVRALMVAGDITGVVDHNLVDMGGADQFIRFQSTSEGDPAWAQPTDLGTDRFVFVEDNEINNPGGFAQVNDGYEGGRFVIRYNKIQNAGFQTHPTGGSGRARGVRAFEIYKNKMTATVTNFNFFFLSSGAGVIWGNEAPTGFTHFITAHSMRVDTKTYTQLPVPQGWGQCPSIFDTNGCLDQPGRGISDLLSGAFPSVKNMATGCTSPDPCANPRQKIEGVYEWENVWATAGGGLKWAVYEPGVLVAGRDYFPDTKKPDYTPYTYPHPLVSGSVAGGDVTAPIPGSAGLLASSVVGSSAAITWTKATDDKSLQPALQYEVRLSTNNDIDTVSKAEAYGAVATPYTADISSVSVPGLAAGTTYFFNVIVKDEAGNKSIYMPTSVAAAAPPAPAPPAPAPDTLAPVPGSSGTITYSATTSSASLNWAKATDDVSSQSMLQYEVRRSNSNNIGTVATAEANGVIARPYTADSVSATVAGLSPSTTYYFNVIVRDAVGNKAVYVTRSVTTAAIPDSTAPIPGGGGAITISNLGSGGVTLNWTKATDDISSQAQLSYEVRRSSTPNIDTVLGAEAYGTPVVAYITDISYANVTSLTPETTYYFNVIVKDAAGNRAIYATRSVTTTPYVDTVLPVPGSGGAITANVGASETATLSWVKATDNLSTAAQLLYEVRKSLSNNIDTVGKAEANGTIVLNYTADVGSTSVTGLSVGTSYYFNVIVKDAAGNKNQYQPATVLLAADTTPPVPGNFGQMTSIVTSSSATINWAKAMDNISQPAALQYEVRLSDKNNISSLANAQTNGTIVKPYTADINTFVVNGLSSGSDYFLNVIVKDEANNKAIYTVKKVSTDGPSGKMTQLNPNGKGPGWKADDHPVKALSVLSSDTTPPIPGSAGLVAISGISQTGLTLRWDRATDETSPQAVLKYQVVESPAKNINTVAQAESNGNILLPYATDATVFQVKGIDGAIQHFFTILVADAAGNKAVYSTAGNLGETYSYTANGGASFATVSSPTSPLRVSQLQVSPEQSMGSPAGLAIVRASGSRGVISTAGLPLSGGIRGGSLYADLSAATDVSEAVRTGIALANPSTQDAEISFFFTDSNGVETKSGSYTLLANHQISGFLDESPFNGPGAFSGTFTFVASAPVSAIGTRSLTRRTGEFLLQSLPIAQGTAAGTNSFLPAFVDGAGWNTEVILSNNSSALQVGKVQFWGHGAPGVPATVVEMTVNSMTASTFNYSLPPHAVVRLTTAGANLEMNTGSIRVTNTSAASSNGVPDAVALISSRNSGGMVSQASVAALPPGTAYRMYVETSGDPEWVSSSVAIVNSSTDPNTLNLALTKLDGTPMRSTSITLPPNGQLAQFLVEIFPGLESGFKGLLRVSSSAPIGFTGFRCMSNSSGEFLFASTPPQNEATSLPSTGLAFPLIAVGAGYDTQVVLFGQSGQSGSGEMLFVSKDGVPQAASGLGISVSK
jgi:Fibronectin type III domain